MRPNKLDREVITFLTRLNISTKTKSSPLPWEASWTNNKIIFTKTVIKNNNKKNKQC